MTQPRGSPRAPVPRDPGTDRAELVKLKHQDLPREVSRAEGTGEGQGSLSGMGRWTESVDDPVYPFKMRDGDGGSTGRGSNNC